jgi:hypothetical protein
MNRLLFEARELRVDDDSRREQARRRLRAMGRDHLPAAVASYDLPSAARLTRDRLDVMIRFFDRSLRLDRIDMTTPNLERLVVGVYAPALNYLRYLIWRDLCANESTGQLPESVPPESLLIVDTENGSGKLLVIDIGDRSNPSDSNVITPDTTQPPDSCNAPWERLQPKCEADWERSLAEALVALNADATGALFGELSRDANAIRRIIHDLHCKHVDPPWGTFSQRRRAQLLVCAVAAEAGHSRPSDWFDAERKARSRRREKKPTR